MVTTVRPGQAARLRRSARRALTQSLEVRSAKTALDARHRHDEYRPQAHLPGLPKTCFGTLPHGNGVAALGRGEDPGPHA